MGPAPTTPFNEEMLNPRNHEFISNFSPGDDFLLGASIIWTSPNGATAPTALAPRRSKGRAGSRRRDGQVQHHSSTWDVRFEFAQAAPVWFPGRGGGICWVKFHGALGWFPPPGDKGLSPTTTSFCAIRRTPWAPCPSSSPSSDNHYRNFIDAIKGLCCPPICDVETAPRLSDTLCQLAPIAP